ncbi:glutaredoxin-C9-like [Telopea speciosissima]|uniref:glutaredoxin-C9-like n=1 Tax=Telopea speciosissima TaxID=54955 RepID=UPI001CC36090|nr:glutaredoxin-C9-like [Telopea speciosissima]
MQQAIPYRTWQPVPPVGSPVRRGGVSSSAVTNEDISSSSSRSGVGKDVKGLVSENAVIVFGKKGCCMCHVVKRLFVGLGVNPTVYEVDEEDEARVIDELVSITITNQQERTQLFQFPAVFIGGNLFGGLDRLMNAHISGELIPILKKAGALWL